MKRVLFLAFALSTLSASAQSFISTDLVVTKKLPITMSMYQNPMSCLGEYGPIGPYGPLSGISQLGFGQELPELNIDFYSDYLREMNRNGKIKPILQMIQDSEAEGALGTEGPLSSRGPLNKEYWSTFTNNSEFISELKPLGAFGVLGPAGPLGPLGPNGPLGPKGPHLLKSNDDGEYLISNEQDKKICAKLEKKICRAIYAAWDESEVRTYDLVEHYTLTQAKKMKNNDSSFVVTGRINQFDTTEKIQFQSAKDEVVTIHLTGLTASHTFPEAMGMLGLSVFTNFNFPLTYATMNPFFPLTTYKHEELFDQFDLIVTATSKNGSKKIFMSKSNTHVDFIQLESKKGTKYSVEIKLKSLWKRSLLGQSMLRPTRESCIESQCPALFRLTVTSGMDLN